MKKLLIAILFVLVTVSGFCAGTTTIETGAAVTSMAGDPAKNFKALSIYSDTVNNAAGYPQTVSLVVDNLADGAIATMTALVGYSFSGDLCVIRMRTGGGVGYTVLGRYSVMSDMYDDSAIATLSQILGSYAAEDGLAIFLPAGGGIGVKNTSGAAMTIKLTFHGVTGTT